MQTNSATILNHNSNNNNNNNVSTKNLQATTDGGQFVFKTGSMSPGAASTTATAGLVTMTKTLNHQGGPAATAATTSTAGMLPAGVQIVNMRSGAPTTIQTAGGTTTVQQQQQQQQQTLAGQKTVATVQPRVVIGSHNVMTTANRPTNSLQLSQGPTLLLKTEGGFQLLRVGPAGQGSAGGVQHATLTTNPTGIVTTGAGGNQTIRLQTMPASTPTSNIVLTSNAATGQTTGTLISAANAQPVASVPPVAVSAAGAPTTTAVVMTSSAPQQQQPATATGANQQNTKEKCRKFLANLLDLSSREPKSVEKNVRTLIQELIDNAVEPEGFCNRLERLLNASPQPCLIGFLKKSLPVLRQSLVRKELTIDGIKPPPHNVAFPNAGTATMTAQVRPVGPTIIPRIGLAPRPGHTTITRHPAPVRIGTAPRLTAVNQLRPVSSIPALHPVQIRTQAPMTASGHPVTTMATIRPAGTTVNVTKVMKVGQTQIRQISSGQQQLTAGTTALSGNQLVINRAPGITAMSTQRPGATTIVNASGTPANASASLAGTGTTASAAAIAAATAAAAQKERKASFYQHNSTSSSIYGDDEINDVAAMGGVNLAEESQRILGSTELIGTQIRSCKDEVFLHLPALQSRIRAIVARHGLEEASTDVAVLVSHAAQERLKNIVEKLAVIAEHRVDVIKIDPRYEATKDVRGQIKFLEELDKAEQKRHEEQEREMLLRAAKSRAKNEDPEQAKLKAKAKEMQRAEMEELRQRDANLTALQAIGQRKKPRLDGDTTTTATSGSSGAGGAAGFSSAPLRPRLKRVNLRDMIFYLEQERETCRSTMLYRAYLK